jgi:predicted aminopeptidase
MVMRIRPMTFHAFIAAAMALALLTSCSHVEYYAQAINGQMEILNKRRPIEEMIASPATPAAMKRRLAAILSIREFGSRELHLPDNQSYRCYADLHRPFVLWNVFATPELSNSLEQSCFPFAGCVDYRGYFSKSEAEAYAAKLASDGHDTYVGGVPAYSTLGWFNDPVLNTFINYPEVELARLIFHELGHQLLYVPGDSMFNESFATTVEEEGVNRWLEALGSDKLSAAWRAAQSRRRDFQQLVLKYRARLNAVYASSASPERKRAEKAAALGEMEDEYKVLKNAWGGYSGYDRWFAGRLNNAHLASVAIYTELVPAFRNLLLQNHGDLQAFYKAVKRIAKRPKEERDALLRDLRARPTVAR